MNYVLQSYYIITISVIEFVILYKKNTGCFDKEPFYINLC